VCLAGRSFTGGVDGKPSIEVLALVGCVEYCLWYAWNIVSGNCESIMCDEQRDLYLIMSCYVNLIICE